MAHPQKWARLFQSVPIFTLSDRNARFRLFPLVECLYDLSKVLVRTSSTQDHQVVPISILYLVGVHPFVPIATPREWSSFEPPRNTFA